MSIDFISVAYRSNLDAQRNSQNYIKRYCFGRMGYEQVQRLEIGCKASLSLKEIGKLNKESFAIEQEIPSINISSSLKLAALAMMKERIHDQIHYSLLRIITDDYFN
jgi:hypothetical protein